jgi:uncharacterized membrane protein
MDNIFILFRVAFTTTALLLIPGYCVFLAFFPRDNRYDSIQRLGISAILGLTLNIIWGTLQIKLGIGLTLFIHLVGLALLCSWGFLIYIYRSKAWRIFDGEIDKPYNVLREKLNNHSETPFVLFVYLTSFLAGTWIFINLPQKTSNNTYTEFFILDETNSIPFAVNTGSADNSISLTVGVINHENASTDYTIQIMQENTILSAPQYINLEPEEKWLGKIPFNLAGFEDSARSIQIYLYQSNSNKPYRQLNLVLGDDST